jgi:hypothetical protein
VNSIYINFKHFDGRGENAFSRETDLMYLLDIVFWKAYFEFRLKKVKQNSKILHSELYDSNSFRNMSLSIKITTLSTTCRLSISAKSFMHNVIPYKI